MIIIKVILGVIGAYVVLAFVMAALFCWAKLPQADYPHLNRTIKP